MNLLGLTGVSFLLEFWKARCGNLRRAVGAQIADTQFRHGNAAWPVSLLGDLEECNIGFRVLLPTVSPGPNDLCAAPWTAGPRLRHSTDFDSNLCWERFTLFYD